MAEEKKTPLAKATGDKSKTTKKEAKKVTLKSAAKAVKKVTPVKPKPKAETKEIKLEKPKDFAIIRTGGKQYKVQAGDILEVEKLDGEDEYNFGEVLLVAIGDKVEIGTPILEKAKVTAKILEETKGKKIIIFKYKPKKRYRKKTGHRQKYTKIQIEKISL